MAKLHPREGDDNRPIVSIDLERLEEEWVGQPKRMLKFVSRLADAKASLAEAEAEKDVVEAEVELDVRENPERYQIAKLTEGAVKARVELHARVREARKAAAKARHTVDILSGAVGALEHRKRALESLVQLHGQGYFASPSRKGSVRSRNT